MKVYRVTLNINGEKEDEVIFATSHEVREDVVVFFFEGKEFIVFDSKLVTTFRLESEGLGHRHEPLYFDLLPTPEGDRLHCNHKYEGHSPVEPLKMSKLKVYFRDRCFHGQFPTARAAYHFEKTYSRDVLKDCLRKAREYHVARGADPADMEDLVHRILSEAHELSLSKDPYGRTLNDPRLTEVYASIRAGRKIQAIKQYRDITGADLKESKRAVERIMDKLNY